MREIKFRAWDSEAGEYSFSTTPESNFYAWAFDEGELRCWSLDEKIQTMEDPDPIELRELDAIEQFTGLLDKRGVEIYESDKVTVSRYPGMEYGVVVWRENYADFVVKSHRGHKAIRLYHAIQGELTVIGNIHEER